MNPTRVICENADELAVQAAAFIGRCAKDAIRERGRFLFVLTGGSTPEKTYLVLARGEGEAAIDWSKTSIFMGDERFVPYDDARSNFGMARRSLLDRLPVKPAAVRPMPTDCASPAEAAHVYANDLAQFFGIKPRSRPPRFDLVLLGLGDDGHVASLFPRAATLQTIDTWVTWSPPFITPPPVDRVTLTFPLLNAARQIAFLVAGEKKADAVHAVLAQHAPVQERPASGIHPENGLVTWFLDQAAARRINA